MADESLDDFKKRTGATGSGGDDITTGGGESLALAPTNTPGGARSRGAAAAPITTQTAPPQPDLPASATNYAGGVIGSVITASVSS